MEEEEYEKREEEERRERRKQREKEKKLRRKEKLKSKEKGNRKNFTPATLDSDGRLTASPLGECRIYVYLQTLPSLLQNRFKQLSCHRRVSMTRKFTTTLITIPL